MPADDRMRIQTIALSEGEFLRISSEHEGLGQFPDS